jgi:hypothetical protein
MIFASTDPNRCLGYKALATLGIATRNDQIHGIATLVSIEEPTILEAQMVQTVFGAGADHTQTVGDTAREVN